MRNRFQWSLNRLVICDIFFILVFAGMQVLLKVGLLATSVQWLDIETDRSLPECFGYAKWVLCILCLGLAGWRHRDVALAIGSLIFLGMLWDDAISVHERAGFILVENLDLAPDFGLKADGIGQILAFATMASLAALGVGLGCSFGNPFGRAILIRFSTIFAALILVGVGGDALHEASMLRFRGNIGAVLNLILAVIEDGGELILGSVSAALAAAVVGLPARRRS